MTSHSSITTQLVVVVSVRGGMVTDARANGPLTVIVEDWDCPDRAAPVTFDFEPNPLTRAEERRLIRRFNLTAELTDERRPVMTPKLPPDPDNMNDARAAWARNALATFIQDTGTDQEDALGDLLADLMHWCDRDNYDFGAALERARGHYDAETIGE
jgi:hypothetical protein